MSLSSETTTATSVSGSTDRLAVDQNDTSDTSEVIHMGASDAPLVETAVDSNSDGAEEEIALDTSAALHKPVNQENINHINDHHITETSSIASEISTSSTTSNTRTKEATTAIDSPPQVGQVQTRGTPSTNDGHDDHAYEPQIMVDEVDDDRAPAQPRERSLLTYEERVERDSQQVDEMFAFINDRDDGHSDCQDKDAESVVEDVSPCIVGMVSKKTQHLDDETVVNTVKKGPVIEAKTDGGVLQGDFRSSEKEVNALS